MEKDYRTKWQKLADYLKPCELLSDDKAYLISYFPKNKGSRITCRNGYKEQWLTGMKIEPVEHLKQNVGRRKANIWLRENYPVLRKEEKYG